MKLGRALNTISYSTCIGAGSGFFAGTYDHWKAPAGNYNFSGMMPLLGAGTGAVAGFLVGVGIVILQEINCCKPQKNENKIEAKPKM